MAPNTPRMEFCPGPELRAKIESYRRELSKKAGRHLSNGEVVRAVLEEFFDKKTPMNACVGAKKC